MPSISALGQLVLLLHRWASDDGRLLVADVDAERLLATLTGRMRPPEGEETTYERAGLELRVGRPRNEIAKKVQRYALRQLRDIDAVLRAVDELGYSPVLVRALLQLHYGELCGAPLGSDAHCAYVDITGAIERASDPTHEVAALIIEGFGPQEIGEKLGANGSRRIGQAMAELARILSGRQR